MKRDTPKRLGIIDLDTGEVFEDGIPVWIQTKAKWDRGFVMAFQDAVEAIAMDKDITQEMLRVWMLMVGKMSFENWVTIPQKEICEALGMQRSNVSRAIRKLVDKGLILQGPKLGRTTAYRLNSHYAWKGKRSNISTENGELKDFYSEAEKRKRRFPKLNTQEPLLD